MFELITSWDDGHKLDLKLARLLLKYNTPGIFFIPTQDKYKQLLSADIRKLSQLGFEIGGHTQTHPRDMKKLNSEDQISEIALNKQYLEAIIGKEIKHFAYPRGRYNEDTIEALKLLHFETARTVVVLNIDKPKNLYKIATTIHVYPSRREYEGRSWYEVATGLFERVKSKGNGYFHLWGHSWEIERYGLWKELELFLQFIQKSKET